VATAAVVLAAGRGSRVAAAGHDTPKPLLEWRGRPLVAWALDAAQGSGLAPVLLVVGHAADDVARVARPGVRIVVAPQWADGMSQSLGAALDALAADADVSAVCVGLADQPGIGSEAYRRLARAGQAGAQLAVATYDGARRNPVLIARALWGAAAALTGDAGARQLMPTHDVVDVDCTGTGDPFDVDTLDDLHALDQRDRPPRTPEA
jgi:molybdenum cofactor cytidylyltransferase